MNTHTAVKASKGFTLIELMITVVVIGILTAVALPNYKAHVNKARRTDAQATLLEAQQFMTRYFASQNTYVGAALPASLQRSPKEGTQLYNIQLADVTATSYNITATPQSGMTSDKCGKLGLSSVGARSAEKGSVANCWK